MTDQTVSAIKFDVYGLPLIGISFPLSFSELRSFCVGDGFSWLGWACHRLSCVWVAVLVVNGLIRLYSWKFLGVGTRFCRYPSRRHATFTFTVCFPYFFGDHNLPHIFSSSEAFDMDSSTLPEIHGTWHLAQKNMEPESWHKSLKNKSWH